MNFKRTLISMGVLVALSGCATQLPQMQIPAEKPNTEAKAVDQSSRDWNAPAVIKEGRSSIVLVTPMGLPDDVKNKKLSLELEPGATVADVVAVLGRLGHSIILADETAGGKKFFVPRYEGTLGGFLSALSRVTDVWFTWHEGAVVVSSAEKVAVSIPQESGFAETLDKGLKAMGVAESSISWEAGMSTIQLTPSQLKRVKTYLERMSNNAAMVTLQVAVVNVSLDQTAKQGVDWEGLSIAVGKGARDFNPSLFQKTATPTSPTQPGNVTIDPVTGQPVTSNPITTAANAVTQLAATTGLLMSGGSLKGLIATGSFSFNAMFDFLQNYGITETRQNVKLSTATGKPVELKSLTQIPYVAEITNSATTNTSNTTNTGSARTEKADDGIEVKMTPNFDAANNSVTIDFALSLKSVIAFNELQAGNQLGSITQPTTSERSFSDVIRVRPGQTVVIGGLTYDQVSDNRGLPVFLQPGSKYESQSLKITRQTMFVVIRPTVEVLGTVQERVENEDYFPTAESAKPKSFENSEVLLPNGKRPEISSRVGFKPVTATGVLEKVERPSGLKNADSKSDYAPLKD